MPAGLRGGLDRALAGWTGGPTEVWCGCRRVRCSGGGLEGDLVAECFELFDEATGAVLDGVAAGEPVRPELAEGHLVADDVVVGDQDVVAGGADRFLLAAAAA